MRALFALWLLLLAGCAGTPEAPPPRAVRFAALVAPSVAGPEAEGALLELVTALSSEPDLDFVLVGGPLLGSAEAADREALAGALGSIAAPVYVALGPQDAPLADLLEALERGIPKHPGKAAHVGPPVGGWRPAALGPAGELPEGAAGALPIVAVSAGAAPASGDVALLVVPGEGEAVAGPAGTHVRLALPPFAPAPHAYAILTLEPSGELRTQVRAVLSEQRKELAAVPVRAR